jgi:hypothetical protein
MGIFVVWGLGLSHAKNFLPFLAQPKQNLVKPVGKKFFYFAVALNLA